MRRSPQHYSLWDAAILVIGVTHIWNLGVIEGSAFWFWASLFSVAWILVFPLGEFPARPITGMEQ